MADLTEAELFSINTRNKIASRRSWRTLATIDNLLSADSRKRLDANTWGEAFSMLALAERRRSMGEKEEIFSTEFKLLDKAYDALGGYDPSLKVFTDSWREYLKSTRHFEKKEAAAAYRTLQSDSFFYTEYAPRAPEILSRLHARLAEDPNLRDLWQATAAFDLGTATPTEDGIVGESPELAPVIRRFTERRAEVGLEQALSELKQDIDVQLGTLDGKIQSLSDTVRRATKTNTNTQLSIEKLVQTQSEEAKLRREQEELILNERAIRGLLSMYAILGGNQKTAMQVSTIVDTVYKLRSAAKAFSAGYQISKLSSVIALASDWVSAVNLLASAFGETQNGIEGTIIDALAGISRQLEQIHETIVRGFATIDGRLESISSQIDSGFRQLMDALAINIWRSDRLIQSTDILAATLDLRLQNVDRLLIYLIDREQVAALEGFVRHRQVTGRVLTDAEYEDSLKQVDRFLAESRLPPLSGADIQPDEDLTRKLVAEFCRSQDTTAAELADWRSSINSFRSYFAAMNGATTPTDRLPNPHRWMLAVDAYVSIRLRSSDLDSAYPAFVRTELVSAGEQLLAAFNQFEEPGNSFQDKGIILGLNAIFGEFITSLQIIESETRKIHSQTLKEAGASIGTLLPHDENDLLWEEWNQLSAGSMREAVDALTLQVEPLPYRLVGDPRPPVFWADGAYQGHPVDPAYLNRPWIAGEPNMDYSVRLENGDPNNWPTIHLTEEQVELLGPTGLSVCLAGKALGAFEPRTAYVAYFDQRTLAEKKVQCIRGYPRFEVAFFATVDGLESLIQRVPIGLLPPTTVAVAIFTPDEEVFRRLEVMNLRTMLTQNECMRVVIFEDVYQGQLPIIDHKWTELLQTRHRQLTERVQSRLQTEAQSAVSPLGSAIIRASQAKRTLRAALEMLFGRLLHKHPVVLKLLYGVADNLYAETNAFIEEYDYSLPPLIDASIVEAWLTYSVEEQGPMPTSALLIMPRSLQRRYEFEWRRALAALLGDRRSSTIESTEVSDTLSILEVMRRVSKETG